MSEQLGIEKLGIEKLGIEKLGIEKLAEKMFWFSSAKFAFLAEPMHRMFHGR